MQHGGETLLNRKSFAPGVSFFIRLAVASAGAVLWTIVNQSAAIAVTALTSSFQWQFVGPEPMSNETANFGGALLSGFPALTATGRVTAIAADSQVSRQGLRRHGRRRSLDDHEQRNDFHPYQRIAAVASHRRYRNRSCKYHSDHDLCCHRRG